MGRLGQILMTASTHHFHLSIKTEVQFGHGIRAQLLPTLNRRDLHRVGVVIDHNLLEVPIIREVVESIRTQSQKMILSVCRIMEPTYDALEEMRKDFGEQDIQAVVGIGGGSAIDMAKAMAVLVNNRLPAIDYRGFDKMTEPVLPVIAIPTTAGTGTEITPNASFIDSNQKVKMGINGEAVRPQFAFLDPELTLSCPLKPTLSAAVDSIVHATEAFVAKKTNPIAQFFAKEGFSQVFHNLPLLLEELGNLEYRTRVMYGAFLSGVALMHSGTGPAAALSYPLGVHYKVPHGLGGAIFLPHVVEYNIANGFYDYGLLLDESKWRDSPQSQSEMFLQRMRVLWKRIGIPQNLIEITPAVSRQVMIENTLMLKGALDQNPVPFGVKALDEILTRLGVNKN